MLACGPGPICGNQSGQGFVIRRSEWNSCLVFTAALPRSFRTFAYVVFFLFNQFFCPIQCLLTAPASDPALSQIPMPLHSWDVKWRMGRGYANEQHSLS